MRAPPEALTTTSGMRSRSARSMMRANFSPTTDPMDPPMKAKSITASDTGMPSSLPHPTTIASGRPARCSATCTRLG